MLLKVKGEYIPRTNRRFPPPTTVLPHAVLNAILLMPSLRSEDVNTARFLLSSITSQYNSTNPFTFGKMKLKSKQENTATLQSREPLSKIRYDSLSQPLTTMRDTNVWIIINEMTKNRITVQTKIKAPIEKIWLY